MPQMDKSVVEYILEYILKKGLHDTKTFQQ